MWLGAAKTYQVRVREAGSAPQPAPTGDAGVSATSFSVKVMTGREVAPEHAIAIEEKVNEGGGTTATFTTTAEGDYTIAVTASFKRDGTTHPGFASYEIILVPL